VSPDDIDSAQAILLDELVCDLDEDDDYSDLSNFMHKALDDFITRDRNYN
jgi:hypothetical protein